MIGWIAVSAGGLLVAWYAWRGVRAQDRWPGAWWWRCCRRGERSRGAPVHRPWRTEAGEADQAGMRRPGMMDAWNPR